MLGKYAYELTKKISFVRTAGSPGEEKARRILQEEIQKQGYTSKVESFEIDDCKQVKATLKVFTPYEKEYEVTGVKMSAPGVVHAPICYIEDGMDVNLVNIKGKIALLHSKMGYALYEKLIKKGCVGFIETSGSIYDEKENSDLEIMSLRERHYSHGNIPGVGIRAIDCQELVRNKAFDVELLVEQENGKTNSHNLIVEIPGYEFPNEWIVLTAHYDSVCYSTGAYDNASGSAGLMELFRHFSENKPKRSLRFIWCGAEEMGLLGSKAYCRSHEEELTNVLFCLNIDMIGVTLGHEIAVSTANNDLVSYIGFLSKEIGIALKSSQGVYSSDSTPFADHGIPATSFARISPSSGAIIHNRKDIIETLDENAFESSLKVMIEFLNRIVYSHSFPITREIPENMKLELDYYMGRKERPIK